VISLVVKIVADVEILSMLQNIYVLHVVDNAFIERKAVLVNQC
jgi:hypothetical protein